MRSTATVPAARWSQIDIHFDLTLENMRRWGLMQIQQIKCAIFSQLKCTESSKSKVYWNIARINYYHSAQSSFLFCADSWKKKWNISSHLLKGPSYRFRDVHLNLNGLNLLEGILESRKPIHRITKVFSPVRLTVVIFKLFYEMIGARCGDFIEVVGGKVTVRLVCRIVVGCNPLNWKVDPFTSSLMTISARHALANPFKDTRPPRRPPIHR